MSQYLESGIYHTSTDVAELLGVSRHRVNILVQEGKIEAIQLGRNWIFSDEALQRFQHKRLAGAMSAVDAIESRLESRVNGVQR